SLIRLGLVTRQTLIGVIATPRWRCSTDGNRDPTKIRMPANDVAAAGNRMTHHWRQSRPRPYHVRWATWSNRVGRETQSPGRERGLTWKPLIGMPRIRPDARRRASNRMRWIARARPDSRRLTRQTLIRTARRRPDSGRRSGNRMRWYPRIWPDADGRTGLINGRGREWRLGRVRGAAPVPPGDPGRALWHWRA